MMEQRTLNIINIVKGNTKYLRGDNMIGMVEAVKQYMADECAYEAEWYTETDMFDILYDAMLDYLDHCDKPSVFMRTLGNVMKWRLDNVPQCIAIALSLTQVRNKGKYINGFDDRLCKLDRRNLNENIGLDSI